MQAQEPPPFDEEEIILQLTAQGPLEWLDGVASSLAVSPEERSPALFAAMIRALEREVEWERTNTGPDDPGPDSASPQSRLASSLRPNMLPAFRPRPAAPPLSRHVPPAASIHRSGGHRKTLPVRITC